MNTLANIDIKNTTVDGTEMVEITLGCETLMLTPEEAHEVSERITNMADLSAFTAHIDVVFDNWGGDDGGTC
jgi:hypothetical protein